MKRLVLWCKVIIVYGAVLFFVKGSAAQVVCNKFDIIADVKDDYITMRLETDLPDDTCLIVNVSRSYYEKGNETEYSVDYLSVRTTVNEWTGNHGIPVTDDAWIKKVVAERQRLEALGYMFDFEAIAKSIEVRMIVPMNQTNQVYGEGNKLLSGEAVTQGEYNYIVSVQRTHVV